MGLELHNYSLCSQTNDQTLLGIVHILSTSEGGRVQRDTCLYLTDYTTALQ